MNLNSMEVGVIRKLLSENSPDTWSQLSRTELEDRAKEGGIISVLDRRRFPDKCNQLGIGAGAK